MSTQLRCLGQHRIRGKLEPRRLMLTHCTDIHFRNEIRQAPLRLASSKRIPLFYEHVLSVTLDIVPLGSLAPAEVVSCCNCCS